MASAGVGRYLISVTVGTGRCHALDVGPTREKSGFVSCARIPGIKKSEPAKAAVRTVDLIDILNITKYLIADFAAFQF
jgi:hypothetical protein